MSYMWRDGYVLIARPASYMSYHCVVGAGFKGPNRGETGHRGYRLSLTITRSSMPQLIT